MEFVNRTAERQQAERQEPERKMQQLEEGGTEMKKLNFLKGVGTMALTLGMGSVNARATLARPAPLVRSSRAQQQTPQQATQKFQGTIVKSKAKYILRDKSSGATYQLDNQDQAKKFAGKDVTVSGTLDPTTNTIQVSEIKARKGQ